MFVIRELAFYSLDVSLATSLFSDTQYFILAKSLFSESSIMKSPG